MKKSMVYLAAIVLCLSVIPTYGAVVVYKVTADATVVVADVNGAEPNSIQEINLKGLFVADVNVADANKTLVNDSNIIWFGRTGCEPNDFFVAEQGSIGDVQNFVIDKGDKSFHEVVLEISGISGEGEAILLGKNGKCRWADDAVTEGVPRVLTGGWPLDEAILSFLPDDLGGDALHGSGNITMTFDDKQTADANGMALDDVKKSIESDLTARLQQMDCSEHHGRGHHDRDKDKDRDRDRGNDQHPDKNKNNGRWGR